MALSKKLKNVLKSSPSTKPLIKYFEELESKISSNNSTSGNNGGYDDTEIQGKVSALETIVGDANTENTLVKDVVNLKTTKANSNHTHTLNNISDLEVAEVIFTYDDDSSETMLMVKQDSSNS